MPNWSLPPLDGIEEEVPVVVKYPFSEELVSENVYRRTFAVGVDDDELIWHRDHEHRVITVLESSGWKLQAEDKLPIDLTPGVQVTIKAEEWHRVIKGDGDLVVEVHKKPLMKIKLGQLKALVREAKRRPSGWLPATEKNLNLDKPFTADSWITNQTGVPVNVLVKNYLKGMGLLEDDEEEDE